VTEDVWMEGPNLLYQSFCEIKICYWRNSLGGPENRPPVLLEAQPLEPLIWKI
jgi:hypothetical protein